MAASSNDPEPNLGDLGEGKVSGWCDEVGIIATPPRRDRRGWDLLLEFPRAQQPDPHPPNDRLQPELTCKVQVKTLKGERRRVSIKLDNMHRMATEVLPWLIVIVHCDESNRVDSVFLIHVGKDLITETLARLRSLPLGEPLHEHTLDVSWSDADRLDPMTGRSFHDAIRRYVGPDQRRYVDDKLMYLATTGYEDLPIRGRFTVKGRESEVYRLMADFAVGLVGRLPVSSIQMEEVRFGIADPERTLKGEETFIEVPELPSLGETTVTVSNVSTGEAVALPCQTFSATTIFPFLPVEFRKFRFAGEYFSLVVNPSTRTLDWNFTPSEDDRPCRLNGLARAARAIRLLAHSKAGEAKLDLDFEFAKQKIPVGGLGGPKQSLDSRMVAFTTVVEDAWWVAQQYMLREDLRVDPDRLMRQQSQIEILKASLSGVADSVEMSVTAQLQKDISGELAAFVFCPGVRFDEILCLACVAVVGPAKVVAADKGSRLSVVGKRIRIMKRLTMKPNEWSKATVAALVEEATAILEKEGINTIVDGTRST